MSKVKVPKPFEVTEQGMFPVLRSLRVTLRSIAAGKT